MNQNKTQSSVLEKLLQNGKCFQQMRRNILNHTTLFFYNLVSILKLHSFYECNYNRITLKLEKHSKMLTT